MLHKKQKVSLLTFKKISYLELVIFFLGGGGLVNVLIYFSVFSEEKSYFPKTFNDEMEMLANRVFEWKEKDLPRKPALVANCLKQLREALERREMVGIQGSVTACSKSRSFREFWFRIFTVCSFFDFSWQCLIWTTMKQRKLTEPSYMPF